MAADGFLPNETNKTAAVTKSNKLRDWGGTFDSPLKYSFVRIRLERVIVSSPQAVNGSNAAHSSKIASTVTLR